MKKYIFIAFATSVAGGALIAHGHDVDENSIESRKDSTVPTIVVELYIEQPKVHKFAPDQIEKSMCQYSEDAIETVEEAVDLCIASRENWLKF